MLIIVMVVVVCVLPCYSISLEELFNNILAIQCTEVFEYAMSLGNAHFLLPTLHVFKYLYLLRLVDYGLLEEVMRMCCICATCLILRVICYNNYYVLVSSSS